VPLRGDPGSRSAPATTPPREGAPLRQRFGG